MNLFFDTSALIKFFHEEEGTEPVTELILDKSNHVWCLELVQLEFKSAIFRRFRTHEITEEQLYRALAAFENQTATFNIEPLGRAVVNEADFLFQQYAKTQGLRTLDALHLGAFSLIAEPQHWKFVVADTRLWTIANVAGFETINPLTI